MTKRVNMFCSKLARFVFYTLKQYHAVKEEINWKRPLKSAAVCQPKASFKTAWRKYVEEKPRTATPYSSRSSFVSVCISNSSWVGLWQMTGNIPYQLFLNLPMVLKTTAGLKRASKRIQQSVGSEHELINYKDTKTKFRHLKKITCKGTLRQVFIKSL